jgi:hypothetical protein
MHKSASNGKPDDGFRIGPTKKKFSFLMLHFLSAEEGYILGTDG